MVVRNKLGSRAKRTPYKPLRKDPRYREIKRMIEDFPPDRMEKLRRYIEEWLSKL